jgi:hypothetical protein
LMRVNSGGAIDFTLASVFLEATMTTIESYYLALCIAAFFVFGIGLSYSTWSWKSWKNSRTTVDASAELSAQMKPQTKLAA